MASRPQWRCRAQGSTSQSYERSDSLEEFGAGLQFTPNATRVLSRLGALQAVRAAATSSSAICVVRGSDDHVLTRMPLENAEHRWGAPYLTIHRADLQRTLAEAVFRQRNVELKLGSTVLEAANHGDRVVVGLECGLATSQDSAGSADRRRWAAVAPARTFTTAPCRRTFVYRLDRLSHSRRTRTSSILVGGATRFACALVRTRI